MTKELDAAPGDIRALKHRIHELEGEVIGYKRILDEQGKAIAAARVQENERCLALMDSIGCDWRDAGDMAKFYATNYLREAIRALLGAKT